MQSNEFDTTISLLNGFFSKITMLFNKLQLSEYSSETLKKSKELINNGTAVLTALKTHTNSLENLLNECAAFTTEIEDDITSDPKPGNYVFHTKNGMLGYPGKEFMAKIMKNKTIHKTNVDIQQKTSSNIDIQQKTSSNVDVPSKEDRILIPEIGYKLRINSILDINAIPPALYYYTARDTNSPPSGIYTRLPNNNLVRIPFPEIVDSKKEYDRKHSIRCKYRYKDECTAQRQKMARMHNSIVRTCNFAHKGDKMIKIGHPARCPAVPSFGNPQTMSTDIRQIIEDDIKNTLMCGLSDIITAAVWFDYSNIVNEKYYLLDEC